MAEALGSMERSVGSDEFGSLDFAFVGRSIKSRDGFDVFFLGLTGEGHLFRR